MSDADHLFEQTGDPATHLLDREAAYHALALSWVDDDAMRSHVKHRLLDAAFFYLSMKNGENGRLTGQWCGLERDRPHDALPARLAGIVKCAAGIARLVERDSQTKREQSDLFRHRHRLLRYLAPVATPNNTDVKPPPGSSFPFTPDDLEDGGGDSEITNLLCPDSAVDEPLLLVHVRTLIDSVDHHEIALAAAWIEDRAVAGMKRNKKVRSLTVRPGHAGDRALEGWLDAMLTIWQNDLGRRVATSVAGPGSKREGEATGPLIKFLKEAGEPLGIRMGTDAWRRHIRDALAVRESKNI